MDKKRQKEGQKDRRRDTKRVRQKDRMATSSFCFYLQPQPPCTAETTGFWLGLKKSSDGPYWAWPSTGQALTPDLYSNWAPNEPDNQGGFDECVRMLCENGEWDDYDCDGFSQNAVCEVIYSC